MAQVVRIHTDQGQASGFVLETTEAGRATILTNYHVLDGTKTIELQLSNGDTYTPKVLGYHAQKDLALLEICCGTFDALPLQVTNTAPVGEQVTAIGYPLGIAGPPSVTRGIISAYRHNDKRQSWVIQTDVAINPGNSGGPLLSANGQVVGIISYTLRSSQGTTAEGISFAVAAKTIRESLPALKQGAQIALPTATPEALPEGWRTYTHPAHGYSIEVPEDWTIKDEQRNRLDLLSPGEHAAVHIFTFDSRPASLEAWVQQTIESLRDYNKERFEITQQRIEERGDGTGIAAIFYWGQSSPEYCITFRSHLFADTETGSAIVESRMCEEFIEEYKHDINRILKSTAPQ